MASGNELTRRKVSSKAGPGGDVAAASAAVTATAASGSSMADERKTSAATLPGSTSVCFSCLNRQMRNFGQNLRPERWKTLLAFLYVLLVSWLTAFVMVIVHDRVPDMERYPPLPDLLLGERKRDIINARSFCPSSLQCCNPFSRFRPHRQPAAHPVGVRDVRAVRHDPARRLGHRLPLSQAQVGSKRIP